MKIKIILFFLSMVIFFNAIGQRETGKSINSGFVFIDGKYIKPPYLFKKVENAVYLNGRQFSTTYKEPVPLIKTDNPGFPEITKETTWDEYSNLINPKTGNTFIHDKLYYLNYTYSKPKIAQAKFEKYVRSLPNVKSYLDGEITTFNGEKKLFLFVNRGKEDINEKLSTLIKLQSKVLNNGGLLVYFSVTDNIICRGSLKGSGKFLFNLKESLVNGINLEDLSKRNVYENNIPKEEFFKLIENYDKDPDFLKRYEQLIDSLNKALGKDWKK